VSLIVLGWLERGNQKANLKQSQLTAKGKRSALSFFFIHLNKTKIIFRPFAF